MLNLRLSGDVRAVTRDLDELQRRVVPAATVSALNKTAAKVRTVSVREISARTKIRQKFIRAKTRINKANRQRLTAWLYVRLTGIPAIALGARAVKRFRSAFLATMPSGHRGIFQRTGAPKRKATRGRYAGTNILREPIAEQVIPVDPPSAEVFTKNMNTLGASEFKRILEHELRWRLARKGLL